MSDYKRIGIIQKAHGIKGELRVKFDQEIKASGVKKLDAFFILQKQEPLPYFVQQLEGDGFFYLLKLEGIDTRTQAEFLRNKELMVTDEQVKKFFAKPEKGIEGFSVVDEVLGELGKIMEVIELPNQSAASLMYKNKEVMVPLNEETIIKVDKRKQIVQVRLPEGLLDVYL